MGLSGIRNMQKSLIAIFTATSFLLITPAYTVLASENQNDSSKATCQKPPEPPKDKDGKPLPPPEGKKPPTESDGKPLPLQMAVSRRKTIKQKVNAVGYCRDLVLVRP